MIHLAKPDSDVEIVQTGTDVDTMDRTWKTDSRCGTSYHIIAFRSMFCQLRVLGRMPLRLKNGWQSFGKDCQGCADCTTWKT